MAIVLVPRRAFLCAPALFAAPKVEPFRGVFPILQTPFTDADRLDTVAMEKQVAFVTRCGVQGMAWPQLASEFWTLSPDERMLGAEAILSTSRTGRPRIVIGVQSDEPGVPERLAAHAARHGAHALISLPPAGDLAGGMRRIAEAAPGLPIFLQAVGALTVEDVVNLTKAVPAVRFVKDEAGVTLPRISAFRKTAPSLGVFTGGHGRTFIDELLRGSAGCMPAAGPVDLYTRPFADWEAGRQKQAISGFARAALLVPEFEQYGIEALKYILYLRGVFPNHRMRPGRRDGLGAVSTRVPLDEEGKRALRLMWEAVAP